MATMMGETRQCRRSLQRWTVPVGAAAMLAVGMGVAAPPVSAKACDGVGVPCAIGDTGPGGGIVFFDAGSRQPWGRYLEATPAGWVSGAVRSAVPGAPRQVKVVVRQGGATVSWQAPVDTAGALRYVVSTEPTSRGCRTGKRSCAISGLVPGRQYAFTVVAVGDAGEGEAAEAVRARVPARPQSVPSQKPDPVYRSGRAIISLVAPDPQVPWCEMGRPGYGTTLPTGTAIGTGRANTGIIVQACGPDSAAGLAAAYRGGGKDDWFLPSKDELAVLFAQRMVVGGLKIGYLWSSSQVGDDALLAWLHDFNDGNPRANRTINWSRVRPIRAF